MTNPFSEDELYPFEREEKEKENFKREAHYRTQKIDCCLMCLYSEYNEDYAKCYFGDIDVDIDLDCICDHFVPRTGGQQ